MNKNGIEVFTFQDFCKEHIEKGCKQCFMTELKETFAYTLNCGPLFRLLQDTLTFEEDHIIYGQTGVMFDYPIGLFSKAGGDEEDTGSKNE